MIDQKVVSALGSLITIYDFSITKDSIYNKYFTIEYKVDKDMNFMVGTTIYNRNDFISMIELAHLNFTSNINWLPKTYKIKHVTVKNGEDLEKLSSEITFDDGFDNTFTTKILSRYNSKPYIIHVFPDEGEDYVTSFNNLINNIFTNK